MTRWIGKANASEETAGGGGGQFKPAPRGVYTVQVSDYKDGITQATKRPKVDLTLEIADEGPEFGKKTWLTVTKIDEGEKGHGIFLHTLHAFGLALNGAYEFDTSEFQGRTARALLGITTREKVKDGRTYVNEVNWVEELYTDNHPEPKTLPPPKEPRQQAKPAVRAQEPVAAGAGKKDLFEEKDPW